MKISPDEYRLDVVYGRMNEALRAELIRYWLANDALRDPVEARRRTDEVVCVVRNTAGEIIGVNSLYIQGFERADNLYFFYRVFIRPDYRRRGLSFIVRRALVAFFKANRQLVPQVKGIMFVPESPIFSDEIMRRVLPPLGAVYLGKGPLGRDVWKLDFDWPASGEA